MLSANFLKFKIKTLFNTFGSIFFQKPCIKNEIWLKTLIFPEYLINIYTKVIHI